MISFLTHWMFNLFLYFPVSSAFSDSNILVFKLLKIGFIFRNIDIMVFNNDEGRLFSR